MYYFLEIDNSIWIEESREKRNEFDIVKFVRK